jgi:hypothetical protein
MDVPMTEMTDPSESGPLPRTAPMWEKVVISGWLVFHLAAIVAAPLSMEPTSQLLQQTWRIFQPYLQVHYLNHGYHYYAPEPTMQSTLVAYAAEFEDGRFETGRFPDRPDRELKPRLFYHRHFMLTEFLAYPRSPEAEQILHDSYARHLCRRVGAEQITLSRITHYVSPPNHVREGGALDDPDSYDEMPLGTYRCDEF